MNSMIVAGKDGNSDPALLELWLTTVHVLLLGAVGAAGAVGAIRAHLVPGDIPQAWSIRAGLGFFATAQASGCSASCCQRDSLPVTFHSTSNRALGLGRPVA